MGGKGAFRQGVAQTVNETWLGVDAKNGVTLGGETAGVVGGQKAKRLARKAAQSTPGSLDGLPPGEMLMPLLDKNGAVVGYERSMDPTKLEGVKKDQHLGRMLGVWAGRILEEEAAHEFNATLVGTLKEIHDKAVKDGSDKGEFVNVADKDHPDPVVRDAWNALGWRIKAEAEKAFGKKTLMVRKDMVNDAIGYRAASVVDPWTGTTRWDEKSQKLIMQTAEMMMGKNAFKWLKQGENVITDAVSYAKTTIIVRAVKVGLDNIGSNFMHLALRGVSPLQMAKGTKKAWGEITEYVKNREEIQALQVDLGASLGNDKAQKLLEARIRALEDANSRLSIKPLLDSGEFSTISEGLTEAVSRVFSLELAFVLFEGG